MSLKTVQKKKKKKKKKKTFERTPNKIRGKKTFKQKANLLVTTMLAIQCCQLRLTRKPPRWPSGRRSSFLSRETGIKPRVGQINKVAIDSPQMQSCSVRFGVRCGNWL